MRGIPSPTLINKRERESLKYLRGGLSLGGSFYLKFFFSLIVKKIIKEEDNFAVALSPMVCVLCFSIEEDQSNFLFIAPSMAMAGIGSMFNIYKFSWVLDKGSKENTVQMQNVKWSEAKK